MAEEDNVSQVKEMMMMMKPDDEHCCLGDAAKGSEIFQETCVETMPPPLMVEDVLLTPPAPGAVVSNSNVNPRRHSAGTALGKAQAQTRYRGNQTSSTHDLCKHGKRREEDLVIKPWKLVKKKDVESGGGGLVKGGESLSVVRRKSLLVAKRDAATTSEVVKSYDGLLRAKRCETKTASDSPAGGVRMVKKTNGDVKKVSVSSEIKTSKEDHVKSLKKKEKKTEIDVVEKKSSKEELVKSLKKKEIIDEPVRCDDVTEKTLYVVESSIEEKKKIIKSVKSEIQQSPVKKILRGSSGKKTPTLIPSLSPSSEKVKEPRVTRSDPRPIRQITPRSKTGLTEKKETVSATLVTKPKRVGLKVTPPPSSGPPTRPVSFRKGKVVEPKTNDSTSTSIKFKKRVVQEPKLRVDSNTKKKKNLKDVGKVRIYNSVEGKREKVVLRHRKVEAKKKLQTLFNNVIEETVNKLEEARKSKVKALVGAFETVISLQDNDMTSQKRKKKIQSKSTSSHVVEG